MVLKGFRIYLMKNLLFRLHNNAFVQMICSAFLSLRFTGFVCNFKILQIYGEKTQSQIYFKGYCKRPNHLWFLTFKFVIMGSMYVSKGIFLGKYKLNLLQWDFWCFIVIEF